MIFLILPHQLFDIKFLDKSNSYILWEHPHYFKKYNYNKKKLVLHRASMKYYFDYLKKNNIKVEYLEFYERFIPENEQKYQLFDPIDKIKLFGDYEILQSPNFLLNNDKLRMYDDSRTSSKYYFAPFYNFGKEQIDLLVDVKSQDKFNRNKWNDDEKLPREYKNTTTEIGYIEMAKIYVERYFPYNIGNVDNFNYPITHRGAWKLFKNFVKSKFYKFGYYQDSISDVNSQLFHSVLSSSINISLINPSEIIQWIKRHMSCENKNEITLQNNIIPLSSFEGYIRQLFWREYQKYCYKFVFINKNIKHKTFFKNNKKITDKWYNATTGILPVDNCIERAINTGYLNHIERLMVVGNYMNITFTKPKEAFRWFMEFSCDSYEWVMYQNVYDMIFFTTKVTTKRPYVASCNYIIKMSNYPKGPWCNIIKKQYNRFKLRYKNSGIPFL